MIRRFRRVVAGALLGWLVVSYILETVVAAGMLAGQLPPSTLLGLIVAQVQLVIAWGWLLYESRKPDSRSSRILYRVAAIGVMPLLGGLGWVTEAAGLFTPALTLTGIVTTLYLAWLTASISPRAGMGLGLLALVVLAAAAGLGGATAYFGAVLVLLGFASAPRGYGAQLRRLFPHPVGRNR